MYNGFDANKTFWTDSNGLEMQERHITKFERNKTVTLLKESSLPDYNEIAGNYFPVDTAIAMRDFQNGSNVQVTVMNDRA